MGRGPGRIKQELAIVLTDFLSPLVVSPHDLHVNHDRSVMHDQCRWEGFARHPELNIIKWFLSYSTMSECVKYGVDWIDSIEIAANN